MDMLMKMQLITQVKIIAAALALTFCSSCSSNYGNNLVLDARDIFSFSAGYGLGAQARVSYLAEGFLFKKDLVGMQNGIPAWYGNQAQIFDVDVALGRLHIFNPPYDVYIRKDGVLLAEGPLFLYWPRKDKWNPKWATQVDATLALGLSIKVGFNPGELLDFITGVFGYDLFGDDYEEKEFEEKKEPLQEKETEQVQDKASPAK
jgi:hypothetical protein